MDHPYRKKVINRVIIIILLISIGLGFYLYQKKNKQSNLSNQKTEVSRDVQNLINKVSQLYLLPVGETPTIATVTDPESLKKQSFFSLAEKGDKVLIFTQAGRAVLYRPAIDKIIEVSSIKNNLVGSSENKNATISTENSKTN